MANNYNQKLRLLKVYQILRKETDEQHPMNARQIIERLAAEGISAERKSIYSDIDNLIESGVDIVKAADQRAGFFIGANVFELSELKLLVDAVSASKFITKKKSKELVNKLGTLTSTHGKKKLTRDVHLSNRAKSENESAFYTTDVVYQAINKNRQISFEYWQWTPEKKKELRNGGKPYVVSPGQLVWFDENYYLVAYAADHDEVRYYRVDKMKRGKVLDEDRVGMDEIRKIDIPTLARQSFNMYNGSVESVSFLVTRDLIGVFIDKFGSDINIRPKGGKYLVRCDLQASETFLGWLTALGGDVTIQSPKKIRDGYMEYLQGIIKEYK